MSPIDLNCGLEKVMQDLDLIKRDLVEIMKQKRTQVERNYSTPAGRPRSPPQTQAAMVGHDDVLLKALDKLTGQQSSRQIIPIVGMGGIGKTTLANNIYVNPLIVQHFDFRGWATISQEYDSKEILVEILVCLKYTRESLRQMGEHELGEKLYKSLSGRRYLIVMDDMWSIEAWDRIKFFFPDYNDGSRIVITTRLSNLARELTGSCGLEVGFLDEYNSWNLLRKSVFGEHDCPPDLEEIGLQISRNCNGLPLSIVVVGGLLAKSNQTQEHWQYIAENLNSVVNSDENERCLRILRLSYNHLPVHLKPCFLYLGIFSEDDLVSASTLVKLWVSEGFLKPISDKTMEEAGTEYLKDLSERNIVLVQEFGYKGNIKRFRIHDLVRDLCIKEAEKEMFFCVATTHGPNQGQIWHTQRRIAIQRRKSSIKHITREVRNIARSATLARSLICNDNVDRLRPSPLLRGDLAEIMKQKRAQVERNYSTPAGWLRSPPQTQAAVVGHDNVLLEALDKLTGQQSNRQIIPIVGMGGIGKTTLAKNIYVNPLIVQHFDFRGWATISQEYDLIEILVEILVCLKTVGSRESLRQTGEYELGEKLYKSLSGRRYLIVMDDIWCIEAWDRIKFFFPDYSNGSRIMITTRLSNLAYEMGCTCSFKVDFLDEGNSWTLFRKSVFGEHDCPLELEELGKKISRDCKGLPLSIVVVGGHLANSTQTREHWQYIEKNLNSVPCFLYLGIFSEDDLISASTLVKLWVAEGFLKPISDKTMEAAGEEYIKDLVRRNLVLVQELRYDGNIKRCRIHDLVRDLCMKEAEKDRFFLLAATNSPNTGQNWHTQRRIGILRRESSSERSTREVHNMARSATLARSLICNVGGGIIELIS
ncbi:disease resistance protein [Striga asiatica]|uniref:Disease resistance protein n=1 Tax=Striga asiatica TaxID=4170 RepID=A0A5A7R7N5_STRAF|nr:disease resistance protein [Striga asiatica]